MQTITTAEYNILKSKFGMGASGHRGRCEIDYKIPGTIEVGEEQDLNPLLGTMSQVNINGVGTNITFPERANDGNATTSSTIEVGGVGGAPFPVRAWQVDYPDPVELTHFSFRSIASNGPHFDDVIGDVMGVGSYGSRIEYWDGAAYIDLPGSITANDNLSPRLWTFTFDAPITSDSYRLVFGGKQANGIWGGVGLYTWGTIGVIETVIPAEIGTAHLRIKAASVEKNRKMDSDACDIEFENEDLTRSLFAVGQNLLLPNNRVRLYEGHGDDDNEVLSFTGLIDEPGEDEPPRQVGIRARDMMKRAIEQTIQTIGPQGKDEKDKVRTTANYVYLDMEASDIISDLLDKIGWPDDERDITPTSYMIDEFLGSDGETHMAAMIDIATITGYRIFADERGYAVFKPDGMNTAADTDTDAEPDWVYRGNEDVVSLGARWSDYDLRTRVRVVGPMTVTKNKPSWREVWHTNKFTKPVGLWYDPTDVGFLKVLDRGTRKVYRLRQSDRDKVGAGIWPLDISGNVSHPLGLSGDPSDSDVFWVLDAHWRTSASLNASIHKYDASSGAHLDEFNLPDGRWTDLKVSSTAIWVTNLDTDKTHKRSKVDGSSIDSYTTVVNGNNQDNPTGLFVHGTTLGLFFLGRARFILVDEANPAVPDETTALGNFDDGIISTAGTSIIGGEMDTTTDEHLYACSDDLGIVWKYDLFTETTTDKTVWEEVVDWDLEDDLGFRSQSEAREHVGCPNDASPHAYEIRRETIDLDVITSRAQARETAQRWLIRLARYTKTVDIGVVGNPALQKGDMIRTENIAALGAGTLDWALDTYRDRMAGDDGTFLGVAALIPWDAQY